MGFISQLYVEHCTVIHIMIAGLYLIRSEEHTSVGKNKIDKLMVIIFCGYPIISIFDQIANWSGIPFK